MEQNPYDAPAIVSREPQRVANPVLLKTPNYHYVPWVILAIVIALAAMCLCPAVFMSL